MSEERVETPEPRRSHRRHFYRLALAITIALVVLVIVLLPIAVRSMQEVLGRGPDPVFDLLTGQIVSAAALAEAEAEATYFNIGFIDLDESTGEVTFAVSGNRICADVCPTLALTFAALDDDADQRRGLPPFATVTLAPDQQIFSESVQLPIRGQPSLYPFDRYELWLGVTGVATTVDGRTIEVDETTLEGQGIVTLQNRIADMIMDPPVLIDPDRVSAATDPFGFAAVHGLTFQRPAYLAVLAITLILLIAVSAALAIFTRGIDELALGFGGLILGVWGVRSVLMPQTLPTVTAVDLALSWLILLLLLGLSLRAALHFVRQSELPPPRVPRRRHGE
jgi:ferredoxin